jgi:DNA-binding PadR family transcriptional regulator
VLAFLESRELITVDKRQRTFIFQVTPSGSDLVLRFAEDPAYQEMVEHFGQINRVLGRMKGSELKNLIYMIFKDEVANKRMGEVIEL